MREATAFATTMTGSLMVSLTAMADSALLREAAAIAVSSEGFIVAVSKIVLPLRVSKEEEAVREPKPCRSDVGESGQVGDINQRRSAQAASDVSESRQEGISQRRARPRRTCVAWCCLCWLGVGVFWCQI